MRSYAGLGIASRARSHAGRGEDSYFWPRSWKNDVGDGPTPFLAFWEHSAFFTLALTMLA